MKISEFGEEDDEYPAYLIELPVVDDEDVTLVFHNLVYLEQKAGRQNILLLFAVAPDDRVLNVNYEKCSIRDLQSDRIGSEWELEPRDDADFPGIEVQQEILDWFSLDRGNDPLSEPIVLNEEQLEEEQQSETPRV